MSSAVQPALELTSMVLHKRSIIGTAVLGSCLAIFSGCGKGAPSGLVPVTGKVTDAGASVTPGILVNFQPDGDTRGTGAQGTVDTNGEFSLKHRSGSPGIEPGKYTVEFVQITKPDGKPLTADDKPDPLGGTEGSVMGLSPKTLAMGSATIAEGNAQQLTFDLAELRKAQTQRGEELEREMTRRLQGAP